MCRRTEILELLLGAHFRLQLPSVCREKFHEDVALNWPDRLPSLLFHFERDSDMSYLTKKGGQILISHTTGGRTCGRRSDYTGITPGPMRDLIKASWLLA